MTAFGKKLREASGNIFRLINEWAAKLSDPNSAELQQIDGKSLAKIKSYMVDTLYSWVLMDIRADQFKVIGEE